MHNPVLVLGRWAYVSIGGLDLALSNTRRPAAGRKPREKRCLGPKAWLAGLQRQNAEASTAHPRARAALRRRAALAQAERLPPRGDEPGGGFCGLRVAQLRAAERESLFGM